MSCHVFAITWYNFTANGPAPTRTMTSHTTSYIICIVIVQSHLYQSGTNYYLSAITLYKWTRLRLHYQIPYRILQNLTKSYIICITSYVILLLIIIILMEQNCSVIHMQALGTLVPGVPVHCIHITSIRYPLLFVMVPWTIGTWYSCIHTKKQDTIILDI